MSCDTRNFETTSIILHLALHTTCIMRERRAWWFLKLVLVNSDTSTLYCSPDKWKAIDVPEFQNDFYLILAYIWLCLFALSLWHILIYQNLSIFSKEQLKLYTAKSFFVHAVGLPRGNWKQNVIYAVWKGTF